MQKGLKSTFEGKKVLVTGHTGFKGSWLCMWLKQLGADVIGYSLDPVTTPSLFEIAEVRRDMKSIRGDIRDYRLLEQTIADCRPEVVFHLAAQSLVLESYNAPQATFDVNVMGTINLLEACRNRSFLKAVVVVTTDKCYDNKEWDWGYREIDPLGGKDPYSASKAMAEMAAASYRCSFFDGGAAVATARAGNVIGGGDFSNNRLLPDCMRALMERRPIEVRNPGSIRPWMHVLDPLYGYLLLAHHMIHGGRQYAEAWNFGPLEHEGIPACDMVEKALEAWGSGDWVDASSAGVKREAHYLKLNWDKAAGKLAWKPHYTWEEAVADTVRWFKSYERSCKKPNSVDMREVSDAHIRCYTQAAFEVVHSDVVV